MESEPNYENCYAVLEVRPDITWSELKFAYRRLSQKWHPDKIQYSHVDKSEAADHFGRIQQAFQVLEKYYNVYQSLPVAAFPVASHGNQDTNKSAEYGTDFNFAYSQSSSIKTTGAKRGITTYLVLITVLGTMLSIILWQAYIDDDATFIEQRPSAKRISSEPQTNTAKSIVDKPLRTPFKKGSSMGAVTDAQGVPTLIKENTWYYGESHVVFKDGIVVEWRQAESMPLLNVADTETITSQPAIPAPAFSQKIRKGTSKTDVRVIQGEPMQDLMDVWVYGTSRIYFKDDKVTTWVNSTLYPLKVEK